MPTDQLLRSAEFRDAGYWGDDTLPAVIDRWADADPTRPYLSDGTSALTYGQFRARAWTLAANLAGHGVRPGDRVAVQLPNWNEYFLLYAACARLGAIMIPVITVYRKDEVGFIVENSGAAALVTCGQFRGFDHAAMAAGVVAASSHRVVHIVVRGIPPKGALALDDLFPDDQARHALPEPPTADDPHLILYSSGTESRPKGCLHTWNTSSFLPRQAIPAMGMTRDDTMFMPSPVTHALGLTLGVMAPTLAGASVHLLDIFDPKTALERVAEHRCTGTASPAPFIRIRLLEYWGRPDLTADSIDDQGWWRTGDVGRLDDSGYLRVTGRVKDIIIRGGFNVSAREVEKALLAMPGIANVAVIGLPDPVVGERVCAVIEPAAGHEPPTLQELRGHLTSHRGMAVWKIPERIEIVTQWPLTATGKVQKYVLRKTIGT